MSKKDTYFKDEIVTEKFNYRHLKRILLYALPFKKVFLLIFLLMVLAVVIALIPPMLVKYIADNLSTNGSVRELIIIISAFILLSATEISASFFHSRLSANTGHKIIADIRRDIFFKLQHLSFDYYDSRPAGKIIVRVTNYINELANFFANVLLNFIINILKVIIVAVFMLVLNYTLALAAFAAIIPLTVAVFIIKHFVAKIFRVQRSKDANRTAFLVESINGRNIIQSFNCIEEYRDIYEKVHGESADNWKKAVAVNELNTVFVDLLWNGGVIFIYALSVSLISSNKIEIGTVIAFFSYMSMFYVPLTSLANILQQLAHTSSNLERIFETMDTAPSITDSPDVINVEKIEGVIDFENVSFAYDKGKYILQNFNLHINKGERIALVGHTGAGKSTIIHMLTRFYDVTSGSVKIDGMDINKISLYSLRKNIGVLMQDNFLFKGTIMDNIRYGRLDATDEQCIEAAKKVFASEFIEKFKNGYYTELSERGEGLSAGEKQLLSFARIVLKNPPVIILDEATSSIDSETEHKIQQALEIMLEGKTSIIIAHRLSTIKNCDRILYIENKGIAEEGTHQSLMDKKGLYYHLSMGDTD